MRTPPAITLAVFFVLGSSLLGTTHPARAFDFPDARRIVSVSTPRISPDGLRVVYVRGRKDFAKDRIDSQLVLVDVRTGAARQLTYDRRGVSSPAWSPDGSSLAFIAEAGPEKDAQSQVFVMPMDGGDARQVTHAHNGVISFAWSPDGSRIAYVTQDDNPDQKVIDEHLDAFQVGDNDYLHTSATPPAHVWIVKADGSAAHRLTHGSWSVADIDPDGGGDISWSPDGRFLAIERFPTPIYGDSLGERIEVLNVASGTLRPLTPYGGLENFPLWSPRGDRIAFERNTNGDPMNGLAALVAPASGGPGVDVRADIGRNVDQMTWSSDGNALWIATGDGTREVLWYQPLAGPARAANLGELAPAELGNVSHDGRLVFVASRPDHPDELYVLDSPGAQPRQLTDDNAFVARTKRASVAGITWTGPGGYREDGILFYPPGFQAGATRRWPLILLIHGGPQGASVLGWDTQAQIFASHGYLVFRPNYRGSTNLGDRYQHAIARDTGQGPGEDVMAGLAAVEKLGIVDTSRIAVSGWSYGGYMTSWLIGHYHVWKAAVSGASLDDWIDDFNVSFYVYTDVPFFGGVPWNPRYTSLWRDQSPILYAAHDTAPTLIMGDIGDNNVTITNSFKLYHALKDNHVTVQFVAYPVEGHFPSDPVRSEDVEKRWLAWIEEYCHAS
jgi:dipeptidyl aminopeptidase/acylaminoacyl peptidase